MQKIERYTSRFPPLKGIPEGILYHYTSAEVFKKIIRTGRLLMTHYKDFASHPSGDANEIVWAANEYYRCVSPLFGERNVSIQKLIGSIYVLSTAARRDNAHLWHTYGDQNRGIVLGIDARALYGLMGSYGEKKGYIGIAPMSYDPSKYTAICERAVAWLTPFDWSILEQKIKSGEVITDGANATALLQEHIPGYRDFCVNRDEALGIISMQKGEAYRDEEETRVMHHTLIHRLLSLDPHFHQPWQKHLRAVLPVANAGYHWLAEIVITAECMMDERAIKETLDEAGLVGIAVKRMDQLK